MILAFENGTFSPFLPAHEIMHICIKLFPKIQKEN